MCASNGPMVMVPVAQKLMASAAIAVCAARLNKQPASTIGSNLGMASSCSAIESGLTRSTGRILSMGARVKPGHDERRSMPAMPCAATPVMRKEARHPGRTYDQNHRYAHARAGRRHRQTHAKGNPESRPEDGAV